MSDTAILWVARRLHLRTQHLSATEIFMYGFTIQVLILINI